MKWIDIGVNLTNKRFDQDRDLLIRSAIDAGVTQMVVTGTNPAESQAAMALSKQYPGILFATAGCHPHDAKSLNEGELCLLDSIARENAVVAIGECGLDFNRNFSTPQQQISAFERQLELAAKLKKPVFLHERDAFDSQYQILKDYLPSLVGAVSHCFTGSREQLLAYLELGLHIGITGWICDERRGRPLLEMVVEIPDERLLLETDAPYLTPRTLDKKPKGGRNEPKFLPHIGQVVADARGQSVENVSAISYRNSRRFFNLDSNKQSTPS